MNIKNTLILLVLLVFSSSCLAWTTIQISNNSITSDGYLLDNSAGFLTPDIVGGKLIAR